MRSFEPVTGGLTFTNERAIGMRIFPTLTIGSHLGKETPLERAVGDAFRAGDPEGLLRSGGPELSVIVSAPSAS